MLFKGWQGADRPAARDLAASQKVKIMSHNNELVKFQDFIKDLASQGLPVIQIKSKGSEYIRSMDEVRQAKLAAAWSTQKQ